MNPNKRLIFLVLALAVAGTVSFLTFKMVMKKPEAAPEVSRVETELIAVAARDVERGAELAREDIILVPFLKTSIPQGSLSDTEKLVGRTLVQSVRRTEMLLESKLAPTDAKSGGMAVIVTPGKRAMAVKVDKVIGVSNFLKPGHFVDVLVSIKNEQGDQKKQGNNDDFMTKMVLENILVLSSGPELAEGDKKDAKAYDVVTLEVNPEEAEKLGLALTRGKIQLALRNYSDKEDELTKGATVTTLLASYQVARNAEFVKKVEEKKVVNKVVAVRRPRTITVEVMNGNDVQRIQMKRR